MILKFNIKKILFLIALLLIILFGVFVVTANEMPKYKGFMFFFLILILIDFYVWSYAKNIINNKLKTLKYFLFSFFWFTLFLSLIFFIASLFANIKDWNHNFRTYMLGLMILFYFPKFIFSIYLLIADVLRVLKFIYTFLFKRNKFLQKFPNKRWKPLLLFGNLVAFSTFCILLYGMIKPFNNFKINTVELYFNDKLPENFDNFKIVQISDLHLGSMTSTKPVKQIIDIVNDLKPDIILFTGDLVNYSTSEAFVFKDELKQMKAPLGVYAILGNHDYGEYVKWENDNDKIRNFQELIEFYRETGWNLLLNKNIQIHKDTSFINIIGVENWGKSKRFPKKGNIDTAIKYIDTNIFSILLSHDPSYWEYVISKKYPFINLTLSGHTHGMQIGYKSEEHVWSPAQFIYKYWEGLYKNDGQENQYLYVNTGIGVIGYPGRIGIKPEITLIKLYKLKN